MTPERLNSLGWSVIPGSSCVLARFWRRPRLAPISLLAVSSDVAASADGIRVVEYEVTLDVGRTLAPLRSGGSDPTSALDSETYWKALRTSSGPATVAARPTGAGEVTFWAWGPGAGTALSKVDRWLGLDDPLEEFDPSLHPVVERLSRARHGVRMGTFGQVFERLVPTILGQLVIAAEAKRSYMRLAAAFGTAAPGPRPLRLAPDAETIAELGSHHFHSVGVERKRSETIQRVARIAERLEGLTEVPPATAYGILGSIRGIGPWTIASVGRTAFGDADAVIVGDYNLPHTVAWALEGRRRSNDDEMLQLLEPFAGHRGRVQGMLKGAGKPPRHGAKLPFREIELH